MPFQDSEQFSKKNIIKQIKIGAEYRNMVCKAKGGCYR